MTPTLTALTGFVAWTLFLLVLMELIRSKLVMTKAIQANEFRPDNANLSPFMQRLARAHANCLEGLPIFGGLMLIAVLAGKSAVTDPLAYTLLGARILQSVLHLTSLSVTAVTLRFVAFAVQMGIAAYWAFRLLAAY
ncbi:MAPEG family protein [Rhodoferax sp.]|uniref:MAPEG family protein n=1 Tax=Rhodoferax sp. TaxID=50421 RepID=UPI00274B589D|nr:MAPEG family protein [Rhodoferax sp.]